MKSIRENKLIFVAYLGLAVALLSSFTTIIGYTNNVGIHRTFNIIDFLFLSGNGFDSFVSADYRGPVVFRIEIDVIRILVLVGIMAIVFAVVGLKMISDQKENTASFILTLAGLIFTMLPALVILFCVFIFRDYYRGTISCGIYPFAAPLAMTACILAATQMHRDNLKYRRLQEEAKGLIYRPRDL